MTSKFCHSRQTTRIIAQLCLKENQRILFGHVWSWRRKSTVMPVNSCARQNSCAYSNVQHHFMTHNVKKLKRYSQTVILIKAVFLISSSRSLSTVNVQFLFPICCFALQTWPNKMLHENIFQNLKCAFWLSKGKSQSILSISINFV